MSTIRFITTNPGKLKEAQGVLSSLGWTVVGHKAAVQELQADSVEEVARHKAEQLIGRVRPPYFLEDAGFFVDALQGFPGVYSHYVLDTLSCTGILKLLKNVPRARRTARFEAVVAFVDERNRVHLFHGSVHGHIAFRQRGNKGFGFDPIFVPEQHTRTFAQMTSEEKSALSHRGRALTSLVRFLGRSR